MPLAEEWVGVALFGDGSGGAMAGDDEGGAGQGEELVVDGAE